jgi:hypothetical protein
MSLKAVGKKLTVTYKKGCAGDAQQKLENYRFDFSSDRAPHINTPVTV